jgi:hypothetical protein
MAERESLSRLTTKQELENARTRGQVVGWIQGAGAMLLIGVAVNLLGWLPLIAVGALGAYVGYRVLFGGSRK